MSVKRNDGDTVIRVVTYLHGTAAKKFKAECAREEEGYSPIARMLLKEALDRREEKRNGKANPFFERSK